MVPRVTRRPRVITPVDSCYKLAVQPPTSRLWSCAVVRNVRVPQHIMHIGGASARVPPGVAISRRSAFPERNGELCGPALRAGMKCLHSLAPSCGSQKQCERPLTGAPFATSVRPVRLQGLSRARPVWPRDVASGRVLWVRSSTLRLERALRAVRSIGRHAKSRCYLARSR